MLTVENLKAFGANTEEGLKRCVNREDFYLRMVQSSLTKNQFAELEAALTEKNLDKAFEFAHAMKGVFANLALTPILKPVSEMTELLRSRTDTDYTAYLDEAKKQLQALSDLAK